MITFLEYTSQAKFSSKQLKAFEIYVDNMFEKFGIDFRFTKHFADRLNDSRNKPMIDPKELAQLIMKIYRNKGSRLKAKKDFEAVLKDITTDINMPVAIEYDEKNDEFDVILKTVMRKKNFHTRDKIIKYK